jgi:hypothetical protein
MVETSDVRVKPSILAAALLYLFFFDLCLDLNIFCPCQSGVRVALRLMQLLEDFPGLIILAIVL